MSPAAWGGVLVFLTGCGLASSQRADRDAQLLSSLGSRSTRCEVDPFPARLPAAAAVVDSATLQAATRELPRRDVPPGGYVLLSIGFDREGANIRRDVIEHNVTPAVADSLQRLVFASRLAMEEAEQEWGVRLRIDLGEQVAFRVGRRELCPPMPRDPNLRDAMEGYTPAGVRFRGGVRERIVQMRALVGSNGIISTARIYRGELSGSSLERELTQHIRQFLFEPARIDGAPTEGWVEIPVRVRG